MRSKIYTQNQRDGAVRGCRKCGGSGVVKRKGKRILCLRCAGKGSGYATKGKTGAQVNVD